MAGRDVLTTRIGDIVKVEIKDKNNPHGTLPNYGNVSPFEGRFSWSLASGQRGLRDTEHNAINAAARAIRKQAATCPACAGPLGDPAISRFDNSTRICSACGLFEAMTDHTGGTLSGPGKAEGGVAREVTP